MSRGGCSVWLASPSQNHRFVRNFLTKRYSLFLSLARETSNPVWAGYFTGNVPAWVRRPRVQEIALAFLRDHASIILNGAAGSGGRGFPTITVWAASKAALRSFARTWTSALQDRKIRVNVLNPGGIATAAQDFLPPGAQEIYAEDGSLREAKMVTVSGINHLTWCAGRRLRNDGHSLPVL